MFDVPVEEAFAWALDYDPDDFSLMGLDGKRKITRLTDDTYVLNDMRIIEGKEVNKTRLIRIQPEKTRYTNTHISGSTLHSQFWYEFFAEGKGRSRLEFTGLLLYPSDRELSEAEVSGMVAKERKGDSRIWVNLAKAMESDYQKKKTKGRSKSRTRPKS